MFKLIKLSALAGCLALTACVTPDYQYTATGATVGGITGAIIGHQLDDDDGRYYGGAAGAILGGAIGNSMDNAYNRYPGYSGYNNNAYQNDPYRNNYSSGYSNSYPGAQNNYSNQPYYRQNQSNYPYNR